METRKMFCAQCQSHVTVTVTPQPLHGGHATLSDGGKLVCLDFGAQCVDRRCAISALPREVMGVRLARSGLRPERLEHVQALCEGCERVTELSIIDPTHAVCPDCDTVNVWAVIRLDGEEWVAVTGEKAEAELG
ncbi:MAG: hypothetical protein R3314_03770 [Longimicrobiales bacterium]|nr:hypothetical protein [Longimicrobiales bacterium]